MRKKIAVIGGGTGLTTAWLLDEQFDVSLFEAKSQLGGHIHTLKIPVNGEEIILEGGAEFINPNYEYFLRLLRILNISLKSFTLSLDFEQTQKHRNTILPPCFNANLDSNGKNKNIIDWSSFFKPRKIRRLFNLNGVVEHAKKTVMRFPSKKTLEEYVESLNLPEKFKNNFLYPLLAAAWGVSIDVIKKFCAHYTMNYLVAGNNWLEAPDGLYAYIETLEKQCQHTKFYMNTEIQCVYSVKNEMSETKYRIQTKTGAFICDETGSPIEYDDVVISAGANVSCQLLSQIDSLKDLRETLQKVGYYPSTLVFHSDLSYLAKQPTIVHTRFNGKIAANTICKLWKSKNTVMKTWVLPGEEPPNNCHYTVTYYHPVMDEHYFNAENKLHAFQGQDNFWYGGIIAGNNDSHESAIKAAISVASGICEKYDCRMKNNRLQLLQAPIEEKVESCCCG